MTADDYLHRVRTARKTVSPSVGEGTYEVLSGTVVGGELDADRALVHLSAFPSDDSDAGDRYRGVTATESALARPSQRKRK